MAEEEGVEVVTSAQINKAIRKQLLSTASVTIDGLKGQDHIAPGLPADSFINVNGRAGDHLAAFNGGSIVTLNGGCARFAGDTMAAGGVIINGDCGFGTGASMLGGILVVRGSAGDSLGKCMRGGTILVAGDAGSGAGTDMAGGELIVAGSAGPDLGAGAQGGVIFVGAEADGISPDLREETPGESELERISVYFDHYGIEGDIRAIRKFAPAGTSARTAARPWGRDAGERAPPGPAPPPGPPPSVGFSAFSVVTAQLARPQADDLHRRPPATEVRIGGGEGGRDLILPFPGFLSMPLPGGGSQTLRKTIIKAAGAAGIPVLEGDAVSLPSEKGLRERFGTRLVAGLSPARLGSDPDTMVAASAVEVAMTAGCPGGLVIPAGALDGESAGFWTVPRDRDHVANRVHPDLETLSDVGRLIDLVGELTQHRPPVLLGVWAGNVGGDMGYITKLGAHGVILKLSGTWLAPGRPTGPPDDPGLPAPGAIVAARRALDEASGKDRRIPLLVRGPFRTASDVFKAVALGADAVGLEWFVHDAMAAGGGGAGEEGAGTGGGTGGEDWEEDGSRAAGAIGSLIVGFWDLMASTGRRKLAEMGRDDLRALSYDAAALTGVKLAGYGDSLPMWIH